MTELIVLQPQAALKDPHMWTDARSQLSLRWAVYEPLMRPAEGGHVPMLAEHWRLDADARTWTFQVRPGVSFHDGSELQAADVVASLDRARSPEAAGELGTSGLFRSYLGGASIAGLDGSRVRIVTPEPMADLPDLLAEIPILSGRAAAQAGSGGAGPLAGSGPYRVSEAGDGRVVAEAFSRYRGGRAGRLERIIWQAEPDEQARAAALLAGRAGLAAELSAPSAEQLRSHGARVLERSSSVCVIFMCNAARGACADRRVRQALNYALDRQETIERVRGGGARPLNGPLTPLHFGYDPHTPPYPYDPARAQALLAEAGYAAGLDVVLDIPMVTPDDAPRLAEVMAEQYQRSGIRAEVKVFADRPAYANVVKAKQIDDACCFDSSPLSTWRVLREKFHAGVHGPWWQGYANPEVDALLDDACATVDPAARQSLYRRAYRLIRDDAPWIFLYSPTLYWGVGTGAEGVSARLDGSMDLAG